MSMMKPQKDGWRNEAPAKPAPNLSSDEQMSGNEHEEMAQEHGPVVKTETEHNHDLGVHTSHIHHAKGHRRSMEHDTAEEAHDYNKAASMAGHDSDESDDMMDQHEG